MEYLIREIKEYEYPVLNDFLYEAIFVPEGTQPPEKSIINRPELQVYVSGFGTQKDDLCYVAQVKEQIARGEYSFEDEVEIYSLPRCWKFEKLGEGKLTHDVKEGFVVEGFYRGENYRVHRKPIQTNSLHIEYDYCYLKPLDCVDISTETDAFFCYPKKQNVVTKLAFATEEIYRLALEETKA